jgi:putative aldouronate transport system permease protein
MKGTKLKPQTTDIPQLAKKHGLRYHIKREPLLYVMVLPALIYLVVFRYLPMYGVTVAFQKFDIVKGYFGSEWVGLFYFKKFSNDPFLFRIVKNTFLLSFYSLIFGFPMPIILALSLNEVGHRTYKRTIQTVSYLPHFISVVVIVGLLKFFFGTEGIVNDMFVSLGVPAQRFWIDSGWFRPMYIGSGIWQGVGWGSIIYLAALSGINVELYDAAYIDGANRWGRMWHITLPGMKPTIILLMILSIGKMMDVGFEKAFLMYSPITYDVADIISTYVYRRGLQEMQLSYSAAVGLFESFINCILIVVANYISRKFSETSLW